MLEGKEVEAWGDLVVAQAQWRVRVLICLGKKWLRGGVHLHRARRHERVDSACGGDRVGAGCCCSCAEEGVNGGSVPKGRGDGGVG